MKKLLALLLCVMMFVAVIPTSAFAAAWEEKAVSNTAIKEAEKSIKNMYTAIATDELVFGTAKSLHDLFDGLATSMFDGVSSIDSHNNKYVKTYHDDLVDNARAYMKGIVGDSIAEYISKRADVFKSDSINGGVDPEKYLNVFVAAVNDAVASEKAQKGIEAFVYNLAMVKVRESVESEAQDIQDAIKDWGTGKWAEFGENFDTEGRKELFNGNKVPDKLAWEYNLVKRWDPEHDAMTSPWAYTTDAEGNLTSTVHVILNPAG